MKARDILQQYQEGRRKFPGESLRGLSFKEKDLSGADFSGADIRGTNFRGDIRGTNFRGAKARLQKCWVVVLLIGVFILAGMSGYCSGLAGALVALIFDGSSLKNQIAGLASLILLIGFWIVVTRQGIIAGFGVGAVAGACAVTVTGILAFIVAGGDGVVGVAGAVAGALAGTVAGTFAFAVAVPLAFAIATEAVTLAITGSLAGATFAFAVADGALDGARAGAGAGVGAIATILLTAYIAYRAMKGDEKHALIRNLAIAFPATGGTCFREADLTDADFSSATVKSTDFREANLIRTCWKDAIKLDQVRPGKTYLQTAKVRELVKTGQGENQNFDRLDLQGANLQRANLVNASFIEANLNSANLQDANLSRAKLVGTFLDQTDLTGATLTGTFIEE
ncbi:MAG: pentapeptide repeat-containing protein [Microcoleaceae cyanobacterium]